MRLLMNKKLNFVAYLCQKWPKNVELSGYNDPTNSALSGLVWSPLIGCVSYRLQLVVHDII